MHAPQLLPAPFPSLHDSTYRHCFGLVYDVRSGGVSSDCALPLVGSPEAKPLDVTSNRDLSQPLHTIRSLLLAHSCHRNCATHPAEWCPLPCYARRRPADHYRWVARRLCRHERPLGCPQSELLALCAHRYLLLRSKPHSRDYETTRVSTKQITTTTTITKVINVLECTI